MTGDSSPTGADGPRIDAPAALRGWLNHFEAAYGSDLHVAPAGELHLAAATVAVGDGPADSATADDSAALPDAAPGAAPDAASVPGLPESLEELRACAADCTRCGLAETRSNVVFGEGNPSAEVMFIGEAPGAREDATGRPFVGKAGELLDKIIQGGMGLARSEVYIANVNKCRPPGNRDPRPDEIAACLPFLRAQTAAIRPKVLVTLGRIAAQNLLGTQQSMSRLRGRELDYAGIPVVATWHPAYLLRNPAAKRDTWEDIKRVNRLLGRPEDPRSTSR